VQDLVIALRIRNGQNHLPCPLHIPNLLFDDDGDDAQICKARPK